MTYCTKQEITYTQMYLGVNLFLHNFVHLSANLVYQLFYHFEFPFIERYKSNPDPWPWHTDPVAWRALVIKATGVLLFNGNVLVLAVYLPLSKMGLIEQHATGAEEVPGTVELASQILLCMLCEDFTFYWTHRMLHWGPIYKHVHKMHHTFKTPVGIAAEYAHPIEFIFGNMLPSAIGPALLGPKAHIVTVFAWYLLRFGETLDGHCGYEFSWSPYRLIPLSGSAEYHDFHHSANVGNYCSFFCVWDTVFGTNKAYNQYVEEREKLSKQD